MDSIKKQKEKYLVEYLNEIYELDHSFVDLFYPIAIIGLYSLYECDELLPDEFIPFEYEEMEIFETIKLVKEFLSEIDYNYLDKFNNALNDGTFDIFHIDNLNENRYQDPINIEQGEFKGINLPIYYKISDGASIVHEFFHYINNGKNSMSKSVFTELISFYMELRYYLFLNKKGYSIKNYYKDIYEILVDIIKNSANSVCYTGIILDTYHNTGCINKENIKFIDKNDEISNENIEDLIEFSESEDFLQDIYDFENFASYLLGGILAINLINEPILNDIKIKYINENFENLSINEIFDLLGFDINNPIPFIYNCRKIISKIEGVIYEDNSNIRSNWSR